MYPPLGEAATTIKSNQKALNQKALNQRALNQKHPDITRCCLAGRQSPDEQIDLALKYDCARLQFNRKVTVEGATRAHDKGLINNLFWSDEVEDARAYVAMGIDVVLTNEANKLEGLKATTNEHE